ncbi:MAG: hypothetical protein PGMFKBFP_00664 [Anaerolineales bacterium]|nr:hypothetical protein [Anaerolineales bacterium]
MVCQRCVESIQATVFCSVTVSCPLASTMRQRHQMVSPGGREPDWRMSHVHETETFAAGWKTGKALATTVPQVNWSAPYSSVTEATVALLAMSA